MDAVELRETLCEVVTLDFERSGAGEVFAAHHNTVNALIVEQSGIAARDILS